MEKYKLVNGILSGLIFVALAMGASQSNGWITIFILVALVLHSGRTVWAFGRNWGTKDEETSKTTWTKPVYKKTGTDKIKKMDEE